MTFDEPMIQNLAVGLAVVIPIIGVIMALKWKNRNFRGSPSSGGEGWPNKTSDDKSDE